MFAKVIIEYPVKTLDKMFTYVIPEVLREKIKVGMKVLVPFGANSINGFVLEIIDEVREDFEIREIVDIVDEELVLSKELLDVADFVLTSYIYFTNYI